MKTSLIEGAPRNGALADNPFVAESALADSALDNESRFFSDVRVERAMSLMNCSREEARRRLAAHQEACGACLKWLARDAFGRKQNGLPKSMCRLCLNARHRELYEQRAALLPPGEASSRIDALVQAGEISPEIWPPRESVPRIGCFQCRHAGIGISTDFAPDTKSYRHDRRVTIFCGKKDKQMSLRYGGCTYADPRLAKPRPLRLWWTKWGALGDRTFDANPVLLEYLAAHWAWAPADWLVRVTGRSMATLGAIVRSHQLGGAQTRLNRLHHAARHASTFTHAQSLLLRRLYFSDAWPKPVGYLLDIVEREARIRAREQVVERVRALNPEGPKWTWHQIQRHIHRQNAMASKQRSQETIRVSGILDVPACNKTRVWSAPKTRAK
jgi:hypothetical protein